MVHSHSVLPVERQTGRALPFAAVGAQQHACAHLSWYSPSHTWHSISSPDHWLPKLPERMPAHSGGVPDWIQLAGSVEFAAAALPAAGAVLVAPYLQPWVKDQRTLKVRALRQGVGCHKVEGVRLRKIGCKIPRRCSYSLAAHESDVVSADNILRLPVGDVIVRQHAARCRYRGVCAAEQTGHGAAGGFVGWAPRPVQAVHVGHARIDACACAVSSGDALNSGAAPNKGVRLCRVVTGTDRLQDPRQG